MNLLKECMEAKKIGISGHIRPDGDCVGACLSLSQYLKKKLPFAEVFVFLEKPPEIFSNLKGYNEIITKIDKIEEFDVFFALDSLKDRLGSAEILFDNAKKTINIDHHISNSGSGDINYLVPDASSTSELIYDLIDKVDLDKDIAEAIYVGVIHDTGVFQYSNTKPKTMEVGANLISYGFPFAKLIEETFYQKTYMQTQLLGKVLMESSLTMDGKCIVGHVDKNTMELYGATSADFDGIVNHLRNIKGIHCAVFMYQMNEDENKISMRSDEYVNVSEIATYFGGGGHVRAAGCTMKGSFQECVEKISKQIEIQLTS